MKPKPTQIEAALDTFNHCMQRAQNRRQAITAALSAAAEVDDSREQERQRNEEHYQAAMFMNEKHRRLWIEAEQKLAALTAAAEGEPVGYKGSHSRGESDPSVRLDYPTGSPFNPDGSDYHILNAIDDIQAAAEVGPVTCLDIKMATQDAVDATIERCAQVAQDLAYTLSDAELQIFGLRIAAVIRALKEKP